MLMLYRQTAQTYVCPFWYLGHNMVPEQTCPYPRYGPKSERNKKIDRNEYFSFVFIIYKHKTTITIFQFKVINSYQSNSYSGTIGIERTYLIRSLKINSGFKYSKFQKFQKLIPVSKHLLERGCVLASC